ncbi:MAG: hypothetical protein U9N42_02460, partial [Campylobacterota bacterium]|nr:hypothetical protein [Campylobacterota bacterium]
MLKLFMTTKELNHNKKTSPSKDEISALLSSYNNKDMEKAYFLAKEITKSYPAFTKGFNFLALILRSMDKKEESYSTCKRVVELEPNSVSAYSNLGITLMELNRVSEAIE